MSENERRRQTAHEMWLQQLTPEQRAEQEQERPEAVGMKYPCHRDHQHETWCLPVNEMSEALQRAIERRG